jgi:phage protein D
VSTQIAPELEVAVNAVKLEPAVAGLVTSLVVTHEPNSLDHFTFTVANEFPDLQFTHGDNARLFVEGSTVTIKVGYVDAIQTIFDGEVTRVISDYPAKDAPTVTIEGHSLLHRLRGSTRTRTFQSVTDSDIATQIVGENGLSAQVEATSTQHAFVLQAAQTDFDFLLERARRIRYELLGDGRTVIFRKPADGKPAACTLVWGDPSRVSPQNNAFALLELRVTLDAMVPVGSLTVRGHDPLTRELIKVTGTAGDEVDRSATTAAAAANNAFGTSTEVTVGDVPIASQAEGEEIAKALFNERTLRFVTGSGSCIGTPTIRAGSVVKLDGLGPRFTGDYLVVQSTHELGQDGYTTRFDVRRGVSG